MSAPPAPVFEAPWHAQVFALTVHLNEAGLISWSEWAERFGATLARHGKDRALDGGEDYFIAWLETLETVLTQKGMATVAQIEDLRGLWRQAYLDTPHGAPVSLD